MKFLWILLLSIFTISVVAAAGSSTEAGFIIGGCTLPTGDKIPVKSCSIDKSYYCAGLEYYIKTFGESNSGTGCAGPDGVVATNDDCCPTGSSCTATGCQARTAACSSFTTQATCESQGGCAWIFNGITSVCRDSNVLSCSDYKTSAACSADALSLGKRGLGTEQCRTSAYAGTKRVTNCRCLWKGNNCSLYSDIIATLYYGTPTGFTCQKDYLVGECNEGQQVATRTATYVPTAGYIPTAVEISASGCTNGTENLVCGDKLIKLPFFTFFNFVSVVLVLGVFYLIRTRFIKYKK